MCCSVLQCVAVCCSVLQCVAVCYSVLQCVAVCRDIPYSYARETLLCMSVRLGCSVLGLGFFFFFTHRDIPYSYAR